MATISLENGKYTLHNHNGLLTADRYGQPWRDCTGDGLMLSLAHRVEALEAEIAELKNALDDKVERATTAHAPAT